jgi:hypothetical protein
MGMALEGGEVNAGNVVYCLPVGLYSTSLNPAAPMLQHMLNQNNSCNHGSRPRLPRRGRHRLPNTIYRRTPDTGGCFLTNLILG